MLYFLALIGGAAAALWLYAGTLGGNGGWRTLSSVGVGGALGGQLLFWLVTSATNSPFATLGTFIVLVALAASVMLVIGAGVVLTRKGDQLAMRSKIRRERGRRT